MSHSSSSYRNLLPCYLIPSSPEIPLYIQEHLKKDQWVLHSLHLHHLSSFNTLATHFMGNDYSRIIATARWFSSIFKSKILIFYIILPCIDFIQDFDPKLWAFFYIHWVVWELDFYTHVLLNVVVAIYSFKDICVYSYNV